MVCSNVGHSQDPLLPVHISDDSWSHGIGSSSARRGENDKHAQPSREVAIEPFTIEDSDTPVHSSASWYKRLTGFMWTCLQYTPGGSTFRFTLRPRRTSARRHLVFRYAFFAIIGYLSFLGVIHIFDNLLYALEDRFPDDLDWILTHWGLTGPTEGFGRWPTDITGGVNPVSCHSHNDYWRSVPLYTAVHAGCASAEADVWLIDNQLYVGHRRVALTKDRTLQNLYINPLLEIITKQNPTVQYHPEEDYYLPLRSEGPLNGIFDIDPTQTFVLLIDFKSSGPALWQELNFQLTPLREKGYLTYFNGKEIIKKPITVVASGNAPFDLLTANATYRDVFFDAPLHDMADLSSHWPNPNRAQDPTRGHDQRGSGVKSSNMLDNGKSIPPATAPAGLSETIMLPSASDSTYHPFNSYYASTSFSQSIGSVSGSRLTQEQIQLIRGQIRGAHQRGLKVRYWGLPQWPIGLRNHVWHILIREGVDVLSVDDLRHATGMDWRRRKGWRY